MTSLNRNWKHSSSLIRHFKLRECIPLYKNVKNRDNGDQKFDLCLKGNDELCWGSVLWQLAFVKSFLLNCICCSSISWCLLEGSLSQFVLGHIFQISYDLTYCFVEVFFLCSVHNAKVQPGGVRPPRCSRSNKQPSLTFHCEVGQCLS